MEVKMVDINIDKYVQPKDDIKINKIIGGNQDLVKSLIDTQSYIFGLIDRNGDGGYN
jgi:hypothetical protein